MNEGFGWNPEKGAMNWRDHRVSFEQAVEAFRDPFLIEAIDDRENYGEERVNLLGMCNGVILHITYTERGDIIWIISARRAERYEQDRYFRENST